MRDRRVGTEDKDLATHVTEGQAATGQDPYADDYFFYRYDIRGSVTNIVDGAGTAGMTPPDGRHLDNRMTD